MELLGDEVALEDAQALRSRLFKKGHIEHLLHSVVRD